MELISNRMTWVPADPYPLTEMIQLWIFTPILLYVSLSLSLSLSDQLAHPGVCSSTEEVEEESEAVPAQGGAKVEGVTKLMQMGILYKIMYRYMHKIHFFTIIVLYYYYHYVHVCIRFATHYSDHHAAYTPVDPLHAYIPYRGNFFFRFMWVVMSRVYVS